MTNIIIVLVVVVILGLAISYIIREKKSGSKCVGCPHGKSCNTKKDNSCGCDE